MPRETPIMTLMPSAQHTPAPRAPRERAVGIALVVLTLAALLAQGGREVAAGAGDPGVIPYFHILVTSEIPIVFGVESAVLFLPATLAAIAVILALRPLGSNLLIDVIPQIVFLMIACAQVCLLYRLVLFLARRVRRRVFRE